MASNLDDTLSISTSIRKGFPATHAFFENEDKPGTLSLENEVEKLTTEGVNKQEDSLSDAAESSPSRSMPRGYEDKQSRNSGYQRDMLNLAQQTVDKLDDINGELTKNSLLLRLIFQGMGEGSGGSGLGGGTGSGGSGGGGSGGQQEGSGVGGILGALGLGALGGKGLSGVLKKLIPGIGKAIAGGEVLGAYGLESGITDYLKYQNQNELDKPIDQDASPLDQAKSQLEKYRRADLAQGKFQNPLTSGFSLFSTSDTPQEQALKTSIETMQKLTDSIANLERAIKFLDSSTNSNTQETKNQKKALQDQIDQAKSQLGTEGSKYKVDQPTYQSDIDKAIKDFQENLEKSGGGSSYVSPLNALREMRPGGGIGDGSDGPIPGSPYSRTNGGRGRAPSAGPTVTSSKALGKNQQEAYDEFIKEGMSDSAARIAVGNLSGESLTNPADEHADGSRRNPGQRAQGIASWDQSRSQRIKDEFGKYPKEMTTAEQAKAWAWEAKKFYPSVWKDLNNEKMSPEERMYSVVKGDENPAHPEIDSARRVGIMRGMKIGQGQAKPNVDPASNDPENLTDISNESTYKRKGEKLPNVEGFIWHHTGGRERDASTVVQELNGREGGALGVQYIMDRDGKIYRSLPKDSRGAHILPSEINNLSNSNTEGMEVIAKDDKDVTPQQIAAAKVFSNWLKKTYPGIQEFGHGEVNPSHKQATEGHSIVEAIRAASKEQPVIHHTGIPNVPLRKRTLLGFAHGNVDDDVSPQVQPNQNIISPLLQQESNRAMVDAHRNSLLNLHQNNMIGQHKEGGDGKIAKEDKKPERTAPSDEYLKQLFTSRIPHGVH